MFERPWLVSLILWGNDRRLSDAARAVDAGGSIDSVDVLPIQLSNLRQELPKHAPVRLLAMDRADLNLPAARYDRALAFFPAARAAGALSARRLLCTATAARHGRSCTSPTRSTPC